MSTSQQLHKSVSAAAFFSGDIRSGALRHDRSSVLKGCFVDTRYEAVIWKSPHLKLLIFFSSTFTDTLLERDLLMNEILPRLRERAIPLNIDVTFVDMRWGVRDENTLDHRTWIECSRELERCREESLGLFFVSLQSEKYVNSLRIYKY
jgi:hypothetical protein